MPHNPSHTFMKGAFILTLAGFVVKILSAAYRVPFQNIVGDIGFYIYQQIYPIYGIAAVLSVSGFPIMISKMTTDKIADRRQLVYTWQAAFLTLMTIGVCLFCFFFFGANMIAGWMGDVQLGPLIKTVAFIYLLLPFLSIWRGYFQGNGFMKPSAFSQMTEQAIRVIAILLFSFFAVSSGYSLYEVGQGAYIGSLFGSGVAILLLFYFANKHDGMKVFFISGLSFSTFIQTARLLLIQGAAICVSSIVLILFQLVDSFSLYSFLVKAGMAMEEAKALKGVFDRGQPLIQLGTVAAASFSLVLVPLVTLAWKQGKEEMWKKNAVSAIKISAIIGTGATVGLVNIVKPTNMMLFEDTAGSFVLAVLSISIFFNSFILVCAAILQGLDQVFTPLKYIFFGLALKLLGNWLLIPAIGLIGAAISTVLGLAVIAILLVRSVHKKVKLMSTFTFIMPRVVVGVIVMSTCLQLWQLLFSTFENSRMVSTFVAIFGVALGGCVYIYFIWRMKLLNDEELGLLPFANRFVRNQKEKGDTDE
ncbi:polysaccharide biosynthesis protein [Bacillus sp. FJAT-50079]|uniref:putative polysaccharide biosynthesis protein n=1 Tax=Bacillus sp. FJAT-50079 TaxID=2833577 RepID=UPI001BC9A495|nr:polysaccharide biosynthesis protein [Bacillus sp. FJAT-50079]MBS4210808.1 polysaccharide biosynthesis protein [Bacillus sp. FJAT-50079]